MSEKLYFLNVILCNSLKKSIKLVLATRIFHKSQIQTTGVILLDSPISYDDFDSYFFKNTKN